MQPQPNGSSRWRGFVPVLFIVRSLSYNFTSLSTCRALQLSFSNSVNRGESYIVLLPRMSSCFLNSSSMITGRKLYLRYIKTLRKELKLKSSHKRENSSFLHPFDLPKQED